MATTTDVLTTQFRAAGHGNVIQAFTGIAGASTAMLAAAAAVGAVTGGIVALGTMAVKTAGQFEQFQRRMDTVFGSAAKGEQAFAWAKEFAKQTPFQLSEVIDSLTQMQAMGLNAFRDLRTLGDTASALGLGGEGIQRITLQLGQMRAAGKATMMDLRPLMQAGVPVLDILKEQMGLTKDQLKDIGRLGLDANATINALMKGLNQRFGGAMATQMDTLVGKVSNLKDAWERLLNNVGKALLPTVEAAVSKVTKVLEDPKTVAAALKFVSYVVAGVEVAVVLAQRFTKALLDDNALQKWIHTFKAGILDIFAVIIGMKTAIMGMELIFRGLITLSTNTALGAAQMMAGFALPFAGLSGAAALRAAANGERAKAKAMPGPELADMFKGLNFQGRAEGHYGDWLKNLQGGGVAAVAAAAAKALGGTAGAASTGGSNIVERFILGGGERLRRGAGGLDINRRMLGASAPVVTIRVESGDGSPLAKAIEGIAQKVSTVTLRQLIADPRGRAALKAALAGG